MSFDRAMTEDARMVVLQELARQQDHRLSENLLQVVLDAAGHRRSRDWLRTQLRTLADLGAIRLHEAGELIVAELRQAGLDHVERRGRIEGIARPSVTD